jgi:hypothetical protein
VARPHPALSKVVVVVSTRAEVVAIQPHHRRRRVIVPFVTFAALRLSARLNLIVVPTVPLGAALVAWVVTVARMRWDGREVGAPAMRDMSGAK